MSGRLNPEEWFPAGVGGISVRRLPLASGPRLRVLEAGPADGPVALLLHGWAVSAYLWRYNILPLAAAGFRVYAPDLPGHGLSDAPEDAAAYTLPRLAACVGALLDALGVARAGIAAQSMGGKIAVQFAREAPARVRALSLYGPVGFGRIPPWQMLAPALPLPPPELAARLLPRSLVALVQRRVYGKLRWFSERDIDEYWAPTQFPSTVRAQVRMLRDFPWEPWDEQTLAALHVPTHVVFGTRDRTVRPTHAERLVRALPEGRLTWIEDGGHVVMEEAPERINALLAADLRD